MPRTLFRVSVSIYIPDTVPVILPTSNVKDFTLFWNPRHSILRPLIPETKPV